MVARQNPAEDLAETYRLMLPDQEVTPLVFPMTALPLAHACRERDFAALNRYVQRSAAAYGWPSLILARPEWSAQRLEERIAEGGFLGAKVYPNLAPASCY